MREAAMSDPQAAPGAPEPAPPAPSRRVVEDWEYRTAYLWSLQVRMRPDLHARLVDWARREGRSLDDLAVEVLRDAIAHRGG
jgi:hypothetical protein